jgi:hypothetical protein
MGVSFFPALDTFLAAPVMGLIGDFQRLGKVLLVIVIIGIVGFLPYRTILGVEESRTGQSRATARD